MNEDKLVRLLSAMIVGVGIVKCLRMMKEQHVIEKEEAAE